MQNTNFKVGQKVTYKVCNSLYTGNIVKVKETSLVIIDCAAGMELYNAGCSVGSEISYSQIVSELGGVEKVLFNSTVKFYLDNGFSLEVAHSEGWKKIESLKLL